MKNLFKSIRNQLVKNEIYGNDQVFTVTIQTPKYPEKIITWLTTNQKAFKVAGVSKYYNNGYCFEIKYKELNTACDFLNVAYDIAVNRREKHQKATTDRYVWDNSHRQEFECPNWSSEEDETGYKACPNNNKGYEYLLPEDSCQIQLMLQAMGYDDYADFCRINEGSMDITEELHRQYQKFSEMELAKTYEY